MAPRRARRRPSGVDRRMLTQREKLAMQRNQLLQGPRNPPVQGPSLRIPTQGLMGTRQELPAATRPAPGPDIFKPGSYQGGRPPMPQGSGNPLQFLRSAFALLGGPATTAAEVMRPTALADGTLSAAKARGDYTPPKPQPPAPKPQAQKLSPAAKAFDNAFAKARANGMAEFTWRGKRYNTRYAGE